METIPQGYFTLIYGIIAFPYVITVLGVISLIVIAILYFTNRRKTALKMLKVVSIVVLVSIAFAWLTKASLGIY